MLRGAVAVVAAWAVVLCAPRTASPHVDELRALVVALGITAVVPLLTASWRVSREIRLERRLRASSAPGEVCGVPVRWLDAEAPFVAGILRPTIYWPTRLSHTLLPRERRAVILHEEHHRRHAAPRRLLLFGLIETLAPIPPLGRHLDILRAELEIEADAGALAAGATRGALASALLRLAPASASHGAGFTAAAEQRVRSLLEEPARTKGRTRAWPWLAPMVALSITASCVLVAA